MTLAFWCVFVGILLPHVCFGIARNRGRNSSGERLRDNRNPRDFPNRIDGLAKRAWDAHVNAFEALPGFAAAVIIAHVVNGSPKYIDILAAIWVVARVAHAVLYIADKSTMRSSAQVLSLACVLGLFVVAGYA